jgi:carbamoyltransferase
MYILGISCFFHDAAAALLQDGVLVAAAEEERFTRIKHDFSFPINAIHFCLRHAGIAPGDVDYVVFFEKPLPKFERILLTALQTFPRSYGVFREAMISWFTEKLWIKSLILSKVPVAPERVLFVEHHLSHAASAFFCSPFDEAAILTVDGVGEWTTTTLGRATAAWNGVGENRIELFNEIRFPHSLGLLYSAFTAFLGFQVNEGEYKVMGMAPYGEPRYLDKVYKLIHVYDDGSFQLDMDYFTYHYSTDRTFGPKFVQLFGEPRVPESAFITRLTNPEVSGNEPEVRLSQHYADVAASIQRVTEEVLLKMARHLHERTGLKKLCMAGGVTLNSVANGRILRETPFEEIYIQPAAGDSGGALGAALYAYHILLNRPRRFVLEHCYWGEEYPPAQVRAAIEEAGLRYEEVDDDEKLTDRLVDDLKAGKVIGWYQGRFEWGPRALGNRSILADPRRGEMKQIVNAKIKFREPFRPFAPVVLEERTRDYFGLDEPERHYPARFMLLVVPVHPDKWDVIPAVTHAGGTGRLQTVTREQNPRYYRIVEKFGEATGVPVLMNTSFNLRGEPIVTTPRNALNTFMKSGLDVLLLDRFLVRKDGRTPQ